MSICISGHRLVPLRRKAARPFCLKQDLAFRGTCDLDWISLSLSPNGLTDGLRLDQIIVESEAHMSFLNSINLGQDEAETDSNLKSYFLKTEIYDRAKSGAKTIIIGRKGSGKSAIFKILEDELQNNKTIVSITPSQYAFHAFKEYNEAGVTPEFSHQNAWELSVVIMCLAQILEDKRVKPNQQIKNIIQSLGYGNTSIGDDRFWSIVKWARDLLGRVKSDTLSFDTTTKSPSITTLSEIDSLKRKIRENWPAGCDCRVLVDRLDDNWDASSEAKSNLIGLMRASRRLNEYFAGKMVVTVFIRSDIYSGLIFHDQDKMRQFEETIVWNSEKLKEVIVERARISANLTGTTSEIWSRIFSNLPYRSKATAEKYIVDRTFKRPRDMISLCRMALERAVEAGHEQVMPEDVRLAEEHSYSESKYRDLLIENELQFPYVRNVIDSFNGGLHKISKEEIIDRLKHVRSSCDIKISEIQLLDKVFEWGIIGIRRSGGAGVGRRGGAAFYYYFDDPSIRPQNYDEFFIHPALRKYLVVSEKRERR